MRNWGCIIAPKPSREHERWGWCKLGFECGYDFWLSDRIIGAGIEVHQTLGPGFQEIIYQRALELEFAAAGLEFAREVEVPVFYKGQKIGTRRVDFLIEE